MASGIGSSPTVPDVPSRGPHGPPEPTRWGRLSLRFRVTLVAAIAVALGLSAAGALLVLSLHAGLVAGVEDSAQSRAADAVLALARNDLALTVSSAGGDSSLVQVLGQDGSVLASSPALTGVGPLLTAPLGVPSRRDVSIAERDFRAVTQRAGTRVVVVLAPLADVQESTTQLVARVLLGVPVLLALISAAVWVLLGYTLHTVDRLRRQVAELSVTGLQRRVDVPVAHDEVRQLAVTMNDLLDRLQRAAQAQRRFVADAAHELRSPLAALRARLEVSLRTGDAGSWQRAAPAMIEDTQRLSSLVDDLLALAHLDESPRLRRAVPVDLDEIVFREVGRLRGTTAVTLDTRRVSAGLVHGDPELLTRVVRNLLSNAMRYAAGRVQVSVVAVDGQVELTVSDDGPGVPAAERDRVFERFHRLDAARTRDGGGGGLGLAIVRDAVHAHSGAVSVQDAVPGGLAMPGALVTVWLPQQQGRQR